MSEKKLMLRIWWRDQSRPLLIEVPADYRLEYTDDWLLVPNGIFATSEIISAQIVEEATETRLKGVRAA